MVTTDKWAWRLRYLGMMARDSAAPRKFHDRETGRLQRVSKERAKKRRNRRRR